MAPILVDGNKAISYDLDVKVYTKQPLNFSAQW